MTLIDGHVHAWDPALLRYPWIDGDPALDRAFLPTEYQRQGTGVTAMVFVQAECVPAQAVDEVRWVDALDWPELVGIVGFAAIDDASTLDAHLDALAETARLCGIRRNLQDSAVDALTSDDLIRGMRAIGARGLAFDACVRWSQLDALALLADAAPAVTMVLDHLGKPPVADGISSESGALWSVALRRLAEREHVVAKLSGLAPEADPTASVSAQAAPFLQFALEVFGPQRCLLGSDWPVSTDALGSSPADWFDLALGGLDGDEREDVAWRTASRAYGLAAQ